MEYDVLAVVPWDYLSGVDKSGKDIDGVPYLFMGDINDMLWYGC